MEETSNKQIDINDIFAECDKCFEGQEHGVIRECIWRIHLYWVTEEDTYEEVTFKWRPEDEKLVMRSQEKHSTQREKCECSPEVVFDVNKDPSSPMRS